MPVERALDRIANAESEAGLREKDRDDQYEAYEKTLRALEDIDADDNDEGITVVTEWIIEQLQSTDKRPNSRAVRRRARQFCERNGYDISNNEWLGV